ncbi:MAG: type II restriction endonuclease [Methylococcales symbiont of Iophon sp. n. MRB-2018]|nr:MAG: type II restriction endonuclease [Methylococcales symbiont of Iophon sp. n. MRB-2018]
MKPLGRFFQVTETVDAGKYFLDIDKVQRYPITFVVKTNESSEEILDKISHQAEAKYQIKAIVKKYIESVEEVINIPMLMEIFEQVLKAGKGASVIEEIVLQSRVEFNVEAEEQDILVFEKAQTDSNQNAT